TLSSPDRTGSPCWSFVSVPATSKVTLSYPATTTPTYTPDVAGAYRVQLIVSDGSTWSAPDEVVVTAQPAPAGPRANAGPDVQVGLGAQVFLSALRSSPAGSLTYVWTMQSKPAGSTATLSSPTSITPSF